MTSDISISRFRSILLGAVGLCCLGYAVLALAQNRPDPWLWYIPLLAGLIAAALIFAVFLRAGNDARKAASDELYNSTARKAAGIAYWTTICLYPLVWLCVQLFELEWNTAFAALGSLTGASYLLVLIYLEWRSG